MAFLLASGHAWSEVQNYTLNQVGLFVREAATQRDVQNKNRLYATWVGTHVDRKTIQSLLKEPASTNSRRPSDTKAEWVRLAHALRGLK